MGYIGHSPTNSGNFYILDDFNGLGQDGGSSTYDQNANGTIVNYKLMVAGVAITPNVDNLIVTIDGVLQHPTDAYTISGSILTFTGAPASGVDFHIVIMGQSSTVGEGSIGADELQVSGDGTNNQLLKSDGDGTFSWINQNTVTASTAVTLATARAINGVDFNGSAAITVTAAAGTLSGATLKSTVVASSLTSVGTLTALTGGTGDFNWDSNTLVVDSSTDRVGIGTAAPNHALQIEKSNPDLAFYTTDGGNAGERNWGFRANGALYGGFQLLLSDAKGGNPQTAGSTVLGFDNAGNVGIGTTSPAKVLHIDEPGDLGGIFIHSNSDGHRMQIDIDATVTSDAEIGDIIFRNAGDSVAAIQVFREGANDAANMRFSTQAASGSMSERMRIDSTGNIGIGDTSPDYKLDVLSTSTSNEIVSNFQNGIDGLNESVLIRVGHASLAAYMGELLLSADVAYFGGNSDPTDGEGIFIQNNGGNVGIASTAPGRHLQIGLNQSAHTYLRISSATSHEQGLEFAVNGTAVWQMLNTSNDVLAIYDISDSSSAASISPGDNAWGAGSDLRIKKDIVNIDSTLDKINKLRPITWKRKYGNLDRIYPGLVAQEVLPHFPLVVSGTEDSFEEITEEVEGEDIVTSRGGLSIGYNNLVPYLIKSIQELSAEVEKLKGN